MLGAAFESWVARLGEREFDEPFMVLLRAAGFFDIHFTHGGYEFGKDFIAKRREGKRTVQFAFQSKAGDIGGPEWEKLLPQMHELIGTLLAHSNFDAKLARTFVLVTTGRLRGKAVLGSKEFQEWVKRTHRASFTTWARTNLCDILQGADPLQLVPAPSPVLDDVVAAIVRGEVSERDLERQLWPLVAGVAAGHITLERALLDNSVCAAALLKRGLHFHAMTVALNAVRIACAALSAADASTRERAADAIRLSLDWYTTIGNHELADLIAARGDPSAFLHLTASGATATYPLQCVRVMEFLGLASLIHLAAGRIDEARNNAAMCAEIVEAQPGCSRPISDRLAAAYAPAVAALSHFGHDNVVARLLEATAVWLCDAYERSEFGLASSYASPATEVSHLLGFPFDFVEIVQRRESLVAVALAELSYVFAPQLYSSIVNDLLAVEVVPTSLHAEDQWDSLGTRGGGTRSLPNIDYPDEARDVLLGHHRLQSGPRRIEAVLGPVVPLALACLARDRLFSDCYPRLPGARPLQ